MVLYLKILMELDKLRKKEQLVFLEAETKIDTITEIYSIANDGQFL